MGAGTGEHAASAEDVEGAAVDLARDHPAHLRIGRKQVGAEGELIARSSAPIA